MDRRRQYTSICSGEIALRPASGQVRSQIYFRPVLLIRITNGNHGEENRINVIKGWVELKLKKGFFFATVTFNGYTYNKWKERINVDSSGVVSVLKRDEGGFHEGLPFLIATTKTSCAVVVPSDQPLSTHVSDNEKKP